jgi:hypothetical protein
MTLNKPRRPEDSALPARIETSADTRQLWTRPTLRQLDAYQAKTTGASNSDAGTLS